MAHDVVGIVRTCSFIYRICFYSSDLQIHTTDTTKRGIHDTGRYFILDIHVDGEYQTRRHAASEKFTVFRYSCDFIFHVFLDVCLASLSLQTPLSYAWFFLSFFFWYLFLVVSFHSTLIGDLSESVGDRNSQILKYPMKCFISSSKSLRWSNHEQIIIFFLLFDLVSNQLLTNCKYECNSMRTLFSMWSIKPNLNWMWVRVRSRNLFK